MSRSFKRSPIYKRNKSDKKYKRICNKAYRRYHKVIVGIDDENIKDIKLFLDSWYISSYGCYMTKHDNDYDICMRK